jgi:uncharacterized membrane protein
MKAESIFETHTLVSGTPDANTRSCMQEILLTVAIVILSMAILLSVIRLSFGSRRKGTAKKRKVSLGMLGALLIAAGRTLRHSDRNRR